MTGERGAAMTANALRVKGRLLGWPTHVLLCWDTPQGERIVRRKLTLLEDGNLTAYGPFEECKVIYFGIVGE